MQNLMVTLGRGNGAAAVVVGWSAIEKKKGSFVVVGGGYEEWLQFRESRNPSYFYRCVDINGGVCLMQRYFDREVCGRRCHYIKTGSVPRGWMMEGSGGGAEAWSRKPRQTAPVASG